MDTAQTSAHGVGWHNETFAPPGAKLGVHP